MAAFPSRRSLAPGRLSGRSKIFGRCLKVRHRYRTFIMKRRYDTRKIKGNRCYSVADLAAVFNVHPATVRAWLRNEGLSVALIDQKRPQMMRGSEIRIWLKERQDKGRWKCADNEMSCLGCKGPRRIKTGTFRIIPSNSQKIMVQGDCVDCGRTLNRFDVVANRHKLIHRFKPDG